MGRAKTPSRQLETRAELISWEEHREALLDEALEESFPASDPPSIAIFPRRF